jgi:hypothetical protein
MMRSIGAFMAGLVAWILAASVLDRVLRMGLAGYAAAEPTMSFTLGMMAARLAIGALTSVIAGAVVASIARSGTLLAGGLGTLILVAFIPSHVKLWSTFPIWYHLTFLVTLVPLVVLGAWLMRARTASDAKAAVEGVGSRDS